MSSWRDISQEGSDEHASGLRSARAPAHFGSGRIRYGFEDILTLLWGEVRLMILVFLVIAAAGAGAAMTLKKTYTASASLLVGFGDEYVYHPSVSDAGRGALPLLDTMVSTERQLLVRDDLRTRVLKELGVGYVFPGLARKYEAASATARSEIAAEAADAMLRNLGVETAPGDAVISLSYKASDPKVAAKVLNTLMTDYLQTRGAALLSGGDAALLEQKQAFSDQLNDADAAYADFLRTNDIGDFAAARAALTQQYQSALAGKYDTDAKLAAARAQLTSMAGQLAGLPAEVPQYRDVNSATSDQLNALRAKRETLAQAWAPGSQPLTEIDAQIASLQGATTAGRGETGGGRRIGANPVYQTAQSDQVTLQASVAALARQKATYDAQVADINARLQHLTQLEPQFNVLSQDRDLRLANMRDINAKAVGNTAGQHLADAVSIADRATPPVRGSSLRKPVLMLAILFAGFTALMLGLLRVFLRPGLPTAGVAGRTLNLPILSVAAMK